MTQVDREAHDHERLNALGYRQELKRVLSLFDNFSVAFSYLSPMVGIYSIFFVGLVAGGPAYIWTIPVVVAFMTLVALVFGELASEYPWRGRSTSTASSTSAPATAGSSAGSTASPCSPRSPRSTRASSCTCRTSRTSGSTPPSIRAIT